MTVHENQMDEPCGKLMARDHIANRRSFGHVHRPLVGALRLVRQMIRQRGIELQRHPHRQCAAPAIGAALDNGKTASRIVSAQAELSMRGDSDATTNRQLFAGLPLTASEPLVEPRFHRLQPSGAFARHHSAPHPARHEIPDHGRDCGEHKIADHCGACDLIGFHQMRHSFSLNSGRARWLLVAG